MIHLNCLKVELPTQYLYKFPQVHKTCCTRVCPVIPPACRPVLSAGQPDVTKMFNYPIAPQRRKRESGESEGKHTHSFARLDLVLLIEVLEFSMQSSIRSWVSVDQDLSLSHTIRRFLWTWESYAGEEWRR